MSFHIVNTGASALTAAQRAVETAAHNTANATTPGYTRQRITMQAMYPAQGMNGVPGSGHRGTGVQVVAIDRLRDMLADLALRAESATAGAAHARAEILDRAQGVLGTYGSGVPEALNKMFAAFDQLALTPNEPAARQFLVESAEAFVSGMNDAARALDRIRSDAMLQAADEVTRLNHLTSEVANLNKHIVSALNGGQSPNDLLDRRDVLLDELATLAGATARQRPDGGVDVSVGSSPLVQGATAFPVTIDSASADITLEAHGQRLRAGGQIGARVTVLATELRTVERQLDQVAQAVAKTVNTQHRAGAYDGSGAVQSFFAGWTADGRHESVTARDLGLAPDLLVESDGTPTLRKIAAGAKSGPGWSEFDGENALLLAGLRTKPVSLSGRPEDPGHPPVVWMNAVTSTLASGAAAALAAAETAEVAVVSLRAQRESANGVNIDEEMVELMKFQHSYDAAARVISIADGMLDTLINRMGAGR